MLYLDCLVGRAAPTASFNICFCSCVYALQLQQSVGGICLSERPLMTYAVFSSHMATCCHHLCKSAEGRALGLAKGGAVRSPVLRLAVYCRSRWTGATNFEQADASRLMQTAEV